MIARGTTTARGIVRCGLLAFMGVGSTNCQGSPVGVASMRGPDRAETGVSATGFPTTGLYLLEALNGRPVADGESVLSLAPRGRETHPTYSYQVLVGPPDTVEGDLGNWSADGEHLALRSLRGASGERPATLRAGADGVARVTFDGRSGRRFTFRLVRPDSGGSARGGFYVAVVDASGRQVRGAQLRMLAPDGLVARGASTEWGPFMVEGPVGEWAITTSTPPGFVLATGSAGPVRFTARPVAARVAPIDTVVIGLVAAEP